MNLHETAMGQRFFNVQLPALINTLKDIAAALPALHHLLYPFRQTHAFSLRSITANMKQMCSSPINASHLLTRQYNRKKKALLPLLSSEASIAFEQYQTAVQCRNSAVLEQAYASGYRTAVQMFAAGLGPQPPIPEHEEDSNG